MRGRRAVWFSLVAMAHVRAGAAFSAALQRSGRGQSRRTAASATAELAQTPPRLLEALGRPDAAATAAWMRRLAR